MQGGAGEYRVQTEYAPGRMHGAGQGMHGAGQGMHGAGQCMHAGGMQHGVGLPSPTDFPPLGAPLTQPQPPRGAWGAGRGVSYAQASASANGAGPGLAHPGGAGAHTGGAGAHTGGAGAYTGAGSAHAGGAGAGAYAHANGDASRTPARLAEAMGRLHFEGAEEEGEAQA
jgi:hypothetical protein